MDIAIIVVQFLWSLFLLGLTKSIFIVIYTIFWWILADRFILNFLIAFLVRPILLAVGLGDNIVVNATFLIEIIKAPLSAFFGSFLALQLFVDYPERVIFAFVIGMMLNYFNFYFIGGVIRNHPCRTLMFILVIIGFGAGIAFV